MRVGHRARVVAFAAIVAGDAAFNVVAKEWVREDLDRLRVRHELRHVIIGSKAAATLGLLVGLRRPRLGVLTSATLVLYFVLAVGAHARVRDEAWRYGAALLMLGGSVRICRSFRRALS